MTKENETIGQMKARYIAEMESIGMKHWADIIRHQDKLLAMARELCAAVDRCDPSVQGFLELQSIGKETLAALSEDAEVSGEGTRSV